MSPVTERIVKSLLQQAHFLHPTQQMVQRHSFLRSDGQRSIPGYILAFINFGTKALVTGTGLQARLEQNTQEIS